jgi:hypothetical protein
VQENHEKADPGEQRAERRSTRHGVARRRTNAVDIERDDDCGERGEKDARGERRFVAGTRELRQKSEEQQPERAYAKAKESPARELQT